MTIAAPPRCGHRNENSVQVFCGMPARYERRPLGAAAAAFFCNAHAREGDRLIVDGTPLRCVTLACEVILTGISSEADAAEAEARTRVQLACLAVGAVVHVQGATSTTARYRAPRPPRGSRGPQAEG